MAEKTGGKIRYIDKTGAEVVPIAYTSWQEASKQEVLHRSFSYFAQKFADSNVAEYIFFAEAHRMLDIYRQ